MCRMVLWQMVQALPPYTNRAIQQQAVKVVLAVLLSTPSARPQDIVSGTTLTSIGVVALIVIGILQIVLKNASIVSSTLYLEIDVC